MRTHGGFLSAACATDFPINVLAGPRPKLCIHSNTIQNLSESCQEFSTLMKDSVDEYHRAKSQIDEDTDDCTCSGVTSNVNYTFGFNYNFNEVPPVKTLRLRLLPEEAPVNSDSHKMIKGFANEVRKPRNDPAQHRQEQH